MSIEMVSVPKSLLCDLLVDPQKDPAKSAFARASIRSLVNQAGDGHRPLDGDDLDSQLTDAGMMTIGEMLKGAPLDAFIRHAGIVGVETFAAWLEMRRAECLKAKAAMEVQGMTEDEDYAWVMSHASVLSEVHINFKPALVEFKAMKRLIEHLTARESSGEVEQHSDDQHVDVFAGAMKRKLAKSRSKGRGGWDNPELCSVEFLAELLVGHLSKGNEGTFEDVATFAMMLKARGADPLVLAQAVEIARRSASAKPQSDQDSIAQALERFVAVTDEIGQQAGYPTTMQLMGLMSCLSHGKDALRAFYSGRPLVGCESVEEPLPEEEPNARH